MNFLKYILTRHTLMCIYTFVFSVLLYGVFMTSGFAHFGKMFIFYFSLLISYTIYFTAYKKSKNSSINILSVFDKLKFNILNESNYIYLVVFSVLLIVGHLIYLGGVPTLKALTIMKTSEVVSLRRSITSDSISIWNYLASFNMKAFIPFTLLLLLVKNKKRIYWFFFIIAIFYAFSLMQKSYIVTVIAPSLIYSIFKKKWLYFIKYCLTCMIIIVSLIFVANPALRGGMDDTLKGHLEDTNDSPYAVRVFIGLKNRVSIVPGEMVSEWFNHIPKDKPFLKGNGYRFLAKVKGVEHRNYSTELYPLIRPEYTDRGLSGSVNAASFMYDYSNFGKLGLLFSGILLAFVFIVVEFIFASNFIMKISLNFFPLFLLSSGAITTMLFSGGWLFTIILFFIYRNHLINE